MIKKRDLIIENEKLKEELVDTKSTLDIYKTVLGRIASEDVVKVEIDKAFKELLCRK